MDITVLVNPRCGERAKIKSAVVEVNQLQPYFRLQLKDASWLPNDANEQEVLVGDAVHDLISRRQRGRYAIAVTQSALEDDELVDERARASVITTGEWEEKFSPPPLKVYLMFQFASALIHVAAGLSDRQIENWAHDPARGCLFDQYDNLDELKRCMIAANFCQECDVRLAERAVSTEAVHSVERILTFVRAAAIRRPFATANAVFIGHGRSKAWQDVRQYVKTDLGLQVEEFNQQEVAGRTTEDRIKEMLNNCSFAVLVMTGEDLRRDAEGKTTLHARENVIHEIGLFQGRLGWERAVVLKEEGTSTFSNISGLTYISFPKKGFRNAAPARRRLRDALEREGLL